MTQFARSFASFLPAVAAGLSLALAMLPAHATPIVSTYASPGANNYFVSQTGYYDIQAFGAQGGNADSRGGYGAQVGGVFYLDAATLLTLDVGGMGASSSTLGGGGGGGSFVFGSNGAVLLIAGGGGGGAIEVPGLGTGYIGGITYVSLINPGSDGSATTTATGDGSGAAGTNGSGGRNGGDTGGAGGGGLLQAGEDSLAGNGGSAGGGAGGRTANAPNAGGFGGGGQGGFPGAGGGGGYNGGGGASNGVRLTEENHLDVSNPLSPILTLTLTYTTLAGGGGSSLNTSVFDDELIANSGVRQGNGQILITYLADFVPPSEPDPGPPPVTGVPEPASMALVGIGLLAAGCSRRPRRARVAR